MDNQESIKDLATETKTLPEESPKVRKRKLLTDPERIWASCQVCKETGNLDNLIRQGIPIKNSAGVEIYKAFRYVYFCGENCLGLFSD